MRIEHEFGPFYNKDSKILILGSIPSVKSREEGFYYAHPQNRFWTVLAKVFCEEEPKDIRQKKDFLTRNHIALWDTLESCDIEGSSDSSIKNPIPNDINKILKETNIKKIYANGKSSYNLYNKYIFPKTKREIICLPSTSPANCKMKFDELYSEYYQIKEKQGE